MVGGRGQGDGLGAFLESTPQAGGHGEVAFLGGKSGSGGSSGCSCGRGRGGVTGEGDGHAQGGDAVAGAGDLEGEGAGQHLVQGEDGLAGHGAARPEAGGGGVPGVAIPTASKIGAAGHGLGGVVRVGVVVRGERGHADAELVAIAAGGLRDDDACARGPQGQGGLHPLNASQDGDEAGCGGVSLERGGIAGLHLPLPLSLRWRWRGDIRSLVLRGVGGDAHDFRSDVGGGIAGDDDDGVLRVVGVDRVVRMRMMRVRNRMRQWDGLHRLRRKHDAAIAGDDWRRDDGFRGLDDRVGHAGDDGLGPSRLDDGGGGNGGGPVTHGRLGRGDGDGPGGDGRGGSHWGGWHGLGWLDAASAGLREGGGGDCQRGAEQEEQEQ